MATPYPTINASTAQSLTDMVQYTNNVLYPWQAGYGFLILIFFVIFLASEAEDFKRRLLYASSVSTFASVLMVAVGFLKSDIIPIMLILTAVFLVMNKD